MCEENKVCQRCKKPSTLKWCNNCWYPSIDDDYQRFRNMLEDGHRYADAAVTSGWLGIEEI